MMKRGKLTQLVMAGALALVAGCDIGPGEIATEQDMALLHEVVVENAEAVMAASLVDLSEALPKMSAPAEPEVGT